MPPLRTRAPLVLFFTLFSAYVAGLVVWLVVGLAPTVVDALPSLHRELHDRSNDDLAADTTVAVELENDSEGAFAAAHGITILGEDGSPLFEGAPVEAGQSVVYRFTAPPPGEYDFESSAGPELSGKVRFTRSGATRLSIRTNGEVFEKRVEDRWGSVAGRVADASHRSDHGLRVGLETAFSLLNVALGLLLVVRRPRDRAARLLAVGMIGTAATFNHQSHATVGLYLVGDVWPLHSLFHVMSGLAYLYALLVFPDGRLVPRIRRPWLHWLLHLFLLLIVLTVTLAEVHPGQDDFALIFGVLIPVVGVAAQTYRLRRAPDPVTRQQSRLLRWSLLPLLATGVTYLVVNGVVGTGAGQVQELGLGVFPVVFALVPAALFVGILRYRLWDIDVVVNKTLLSVGLAGFIGLVYVVVVVIVGQVIGAGGPVAGLQIAATAIVAVAFQPVRARLQRLANRLVYGRRATPYEVMADLGDRLGSAISVDEVLPRVAEAAARAVGAPMGRATVLLPGGNHRSVVWPTDVPPIPLAQRVPVLHRDRPIGEVAVAVAPGGRLLTGERELLAALASQAGLAFHNAGLALELEERLRAISDQATELRASRNRIVTARQVLRQRVVAAIHERVEVRLGVAMAGLAEAEAAVALDHERAARILEDVSDAAQSALDALRDLARGIFPALLADRGVLVALEAHLVKMRLPVTIETASLGPGDRFDPQAEAGTFFCLQEVLATAARYPPDSALFVLLTGGEDRLAFSITGRGLDALLGEADLRGMQDRVEAMGGRLDVADLPGPATTLGGWVPATSMAGTGTGTGTKVAAGPR